MRLPKRKGGGLVVSSSLLRGISCKGRRPSGTVADGPGLVRCSSVFWGVYGGVRIQEA